MKRKFCISYCLLSLIFAVLAAVIYILTRLGFPVLHFSGVFSFANLLFFLSALIVGGCIVKISVDHWFSENSGDTMDLKDKILVFLLISLTVLCIALFVFTVLYHNLLGLSATALDNMGLRLLILFLANIYTSYAFYQQYCIIRYT